MSTKDKNNDGRGSLRLTVKKKVYAKRVISNPLVVQRTGRYDITEIVSLIVTVKCLEAPLFEQTCFTVILCGQDGVQ